MGKQSEPISLPPGTKVPNHIALILDGNRRWARARGLSPWEGHKAGAEAVKTLARTSREFGVHTFTIWAFSTENWDRPKQEIDRIMEILDKMLDEFEKEVHKNKIRFVHLGRRDRLPENILTKIRELEKATQEYSENTLNVALDYGGHDEIIRAVNKIIKEGKPEISIKEFENYLDTANQTYPYVDLFIRTSGEQRTSGLLPWQLDYAEFYFEPDHLPDFNPAKLKEAILDYSRRRRRFGANDVEEHLKFNPKVVADLELRWRHALSIGQNETFKDLAIKYMKEHYGLSKDLAKTAGLSMAKALIYGQQAEWGKAKEALSGLYGVLQKTLKLAFEPDLVANIEIGLWRGGQTEEDMRHLLAEKFRFSTFQAAKSARLAHLANIEMDSKNWAKAKGYLEKFYEALKERVA